MKRKIISEFQELKEEIKTAQYWSYADSGIEGDIKEIQRHLEAIDNRMIKLIELIQSIVSDNE